MRSLFILALVALTVYASPVQQQLDDDSARILKAFKDNQIIPDVLSLPALSPPELLKVTYSGKIINLGTIIYPDDTDNQPKVSWTADSNALYTLAKVDPDAPSRADPEWREWRHWLVVNIPGSNINSGNVVTEYTPSTPPFGTSYHRYTLLVYKQPSKLDPNSLGVDDDPAGFDIEQFAKKQNLGRPIAGNFFLCQEA